MRKIFFVLALTAVSVAAADATGKWSGTLTAPNPDDAKRPAFLVLKQDGVRLTGTAGPNGNEQHEIEEGRAEGGRLTFRIGEKSMKFDLKQVGDEITGEVTRERDGETVKGTLTVKRDAAGH